MTCTILPDVPYFLYSGDEKAQCQKSTTGQDKDGDGGIMRSENRESKEGPRSQKLPHSGDQKQGEGKAQSHGKTVHR